MDFLPAKQPSSQLAFSNLVYFSPADFSSLRQMTKFKPEGVPADQIHVRVETPSGVFFFNATEHKEVERTKIALNGTQRTECNVSFETQVTVQPHQITPREIMNELTVSVKLHTESDPGSAPLDVDYEKLEKIFNKSFNQHMLRCGQSVLVKLRKILKITVTGLSCGMEGAGETNQGQYVAQSTTLHIEKDPSTNIRLSGAGSYKEKNLFSHTFDFGQLGIGGLDREFKDIFRRAFASRLFPQHVLEQVGMQHVRGMLLYGPPGCGKTLIARQIGKVLKAREPKIVSGPEILDKFVGASEEKIRALFADAEKEQSLEGANSMLHIIIFDEFDAICKSRGTSRDSTGVQDSIVNQLLAKIDGVEALNNILIIGMTNRKEIIDDAILRPGRLEIHMEIGLPDEAGRLQILNIHTAHMRENGRMDPSAIEKLGELAERTKNFSGAELAGLVRSATSTAMSRCVNNDTADSTITVDQSNLKLMWSDFEVALGEVHPKYGTPTQDLEEYYLNGIIDYGPVFVDIQRRLAALVNQVKTSEKTPLLTCLLEGDAMTGKTALATHLAVQSEFPFVRVISADSMIGLLESQKATQIQRVFHDAAKSNLSVIVIDDLERILEYTPIGPRFSNVVLQTLLVLLKKPVSSKHRTLVVATTSIAHLLEELQLISAFTHSIRVNKLDAAAARKVIQHQANYEFAIPPSSAEVEGMCTAVVEPVGIKRLIMHLEMARDDTRLSAERFMSGVEDLYR